LQDPRKIVGLKAVNDSWVQIGRLLSDAREKAGMSVDDVVFQARIPRTVIEALEAEDFSVFTSPTYAKSFLRQYSDFLQVNAGPWLNALEPASYVSGEAWQPMFAGGPPAGASRDSRRAPKEPSASSGNSWSTVWVMILTAALVLAVMGGYRKFEEQFGKEEPHDAVEKKAEASAPVKAPAKPVADTVVAAPEPVKEQPVAPVPRAIIVRD
jgi:cytoskeletal protein RodZ